MAKGVGEEVRVFLGPKAIQASLAHQALLGSPVLMVQKASGVTQANKESLVLLERTEFQGHLEKEGPQEQTDLKGHQASQALSEWLDLLGKLDQLENLEPLDQLGFLVILVVRETQEKKVLLGHMDRGVNLEYLGNLACQDFLEKEDYRDCRYKHHICI